jgi:sulfite dehydrogenase
MNRRDLIVGAGAAALAAGSARAVERPRWMSPLLPDGTREEAVLEALPGKQKLIRLADRPPNYETPIDAFRTAITPNEDFFVRYHLANIQPMADLGNWSLNVGGEAAERQITIGLDDLQNNFEQVEVVAVCQCSGNRRGLSSPHVAGVQWAYGAMGSAAWSGPRLKDVLAKVGVKSDAVEVWLDGADGAVLPTTPDFRKSLPMDKALADEVIVATSMNGQKLPHLNGYPARVVVPGWTATYWMKHVTGIQLSAKPLDSFWMQKAYRVPAGMFPVDHPFPTQDNQTAWPITDIVVNSVIAGPVEGTRLTAAGFTVQGVAWDRGHGISQVEVSLDGGKTWQAAKLQKDLGRFAFRAFTFATGRLPAGDYIVASRATNNAGETQVDKLKFNAAGYHNNVPQQVAVTVA